MTKLLVPLGQDVLFDKRYPVWKCPNCGNFNRFLNTFFELCSNCEEDHTLDWDQYII